MNTTRALMGHQVAVLELWNGGRDRGWVGVEPSTVIGQEVRYTLDRSTAHHRADIGTYKPYLQAIGSHQLT